MFYLKKQRGGSFCCYACQENLQPDKAVLLFAYNILLYSLKFTLTFTYSLSYQSQCLIYPLFSLRSFVIPALFSLPALIYSLSILITTLSSHLLSLLTSSHLFFSTLRPNPFPCSPNSFSFLRYMLLLSSL